MDRWLTRVEKDQARRRHVAQKDRPRQALDLTDRCYDGNGHKLSDGLCPAGVVNVEGTPRTVAGDSITTDANKCQLKPLDRNADYGPLPFTDAQWAQLQAIFPRRRLRLLQAGRRTAGNDPLADLPERPRRGDLRRQAARVRAEEQALQAEAALVASARRRQAWWATRSMLARWRT